MLIFVWAAFAALVMLAKPDSLDGIDAQYWDWCRHLQGSYVNKPPLLTYLYGALVFLFGRHEFAIELPRLFFAVAAIAIIGGLAWEAFGDFNSASMAVGIACLTPQTLLSVFPAGTALPALCFWFAAIWAFTRALGGKRGMWAATGIALGLGLLCRYTQAFPMLAFAVYLIVFDRKRLKRAGPWLALAIAAALNAGVLIWNIRYAWISMTHMASIGRIENAGESASAFKTIADFFYGQLHSFGPIAVYGLFIFFAYAVARPKHFPKHLVYPSLLSCLALLAAYGLFSGSREIRASWTIYAWLHAPIVAAWALSAIFPRRALLASILACAGIYMFANDCIASSKRPGKDLGHLIAGIDRQFMRDGDVFIGANHNVIGLLAFYSQPGRRVCAIPRLDYHINQYDLWPDMTPEKGCNGIFAALCAPEFYTVLEPLLIGKESVFSSVSFAQCLPVKENPDTEDHILLIRFGGFNGWEDALTQTIDEKIDEVRRSRGRGP